MHISVRLGKAKVLKLPKPLSGYLSLGLRVSNAMSTESIIQLTVFLTIWAIPFIIIVVWSAKQWSINYVLNKYGFTTSAEIISCTRKLGRNLRYYVDYQFIISKNSEQNQTYNARQQIGSNTTATLKTDLKKNLNQGWQQSEARDRS
jgi:hypothetical protein